MLSLTIDQLRDLAGQDLGTSAWHRVTQSHIAGFADATDDHEPLHVDLDRAARTPWGVPIAHGLYTLSLGPKFVYEIFEVTNDSVRLNYGFDRVRFLSPVRVDSRIRMAAHLVSVDPISGGSRFRIRQTFEVEDQDKPACVADAIFAYFD
jgi:acyl dehydratase